MSPGLIIEDFALPMRQSQSKSSDDIIPAHVLDTESELAITNDQAHLFTLRARLIKSYVELYRRTTQSQVLASALIHARHLLSTARYDEAIPSDPVRQLGEILLLEYERAGDAAVLEEAFNLTSEFADTLSPKTYDDFGLLACHAKILRRKYEASGQSRYLQHALSAAERAATCISQHDPIIHASCHAALADIEHELFERTGEMQHIDNAIKAMEVAVACHKAPDVSEILKCRLGDQLESRYRFSNDTNDLHKATEYKESVRLSDCTGTLDYPDILNSLACNFLLRFENYSDPDLLHAAYDHSMSVQAYKHGWELERAGWMLTFVRILKWKYDFTMDSAFICRAKDVVVNAIDSTCAKHIRHPYLLYQSSDIEARLFRDQGDPSHLAKAIEYIDRASELAAQDHYFRGRLLAARSLGLNRRYVHSEHGGDLNEAIRLMYTAIKLTSAELSLQPWFLDSLGNMLHSRHYQHGGQETLKEVFLHAETALNLTSPNSIWYPHRQNNLASKLWTKAKVTGSALDMNRSIQLFKEAIQNTPSTHGLRASRMRTLSFKLRDHFKKTADVGSLESAIAYARDALKLIGPKQDGRPLYCEALASSLQERSRRNNSSADLDEALQLIQAAISIAEKVGKPTYLYLTNLGTLMDDYHKRTQSSDDLHQSVYAHQRATESINPSDVRYPLTLSNLADSLYSVWKATGDELSLERARDRWTQALALTPNDDVLRTSRQVMLATSLQSLASARGDGSSLDRSIELIQHALDLPSPDPRTHSATLQNAGNAFFTLYEHKNRVSDLETALKLTEEARSLAITHHYQQAQAETEQNLSNYLYARYLRNKELWKFPPFRWTTNRRSEQPWRLPSSPTD